MDYTFLLKLRVVFCFVFLNVVSFVLWDIFFAFAVFCSVNGAQEAIALQMWSTWHNLLVQNFFLISLSLVNWKNSFQLVQLVSGESILYFNVEYKLHCLYLPMSSLIIISKFSEVNLNLLSFAQWYSMRHLLCLLANVVTLLRINFLLWVIILIIHLWSFSASRLDFYTV